MSYAADTNLALVTISTLKTSIPYAPSYASNDTRLLQTFIDSDAEKLKSLTDLTNIYTISNKTIILSNGDTGIIKN